MSIIQRFFSSPPSLLRKITKPSNVINEVSPNLFDNLRDSTKQFIKAVANKDVDYVRQVTGKTLRNRLTAQLQQQKDADFEKLYTLSRYHFDSAQFFQISPYVIFGQEFLARVQRQKLWSQIIPISSNKFIKLNKQLNWIQRFKTYQQKQIFGFHCFYQPLLLNVADDQRIGLTRPFMVTFQTDYYGNDPYIVDCQGVLFEEWRNSGYSRDEL